MSKYENILGNMSAVYVIGVFTFHHKYEIKYVARWCWCSDSTYNIWVCPYTKRT